MNLVEAKNTIIIKTATKRSLLNINTSWFCWLEGLKEYFVSVWSSVQYDALGMWSGKNGLMSLLYNYLKLNLFNFGRNKPDYPLKEARTKKVKSLRKLIKGIWGAKHGHTYLILIKHTFTRKNKQMGQNKRKLLFICREYKKLLCHWRCIPTVWTNVWQQQSKKGGLFLLTVPAYRQSGRKVTESS